MKILADENIPFVREAFGGLGEVMTRAGTEIIPGNLCDADVLLVRSITTVDAELLRHSSVRFVGTATIGTDHINLDDLEERGIGFAAAPGSNAESVAQYVTAALLVMANRRGIDLAGKIIGIVGAGNTGSRVARNAAALGMEVLLNDPPLKRQTGDQKYLHLEELHDLDFLSVHVPLTREGANRTWHLVDKRFLRQMGSGCTLINSSRGAVVDDAALLEALDQGILSEAVIDVWQGEPNVSVELMRKASMSTPHIAGYALDGKVRGTLMLHAAVCDFLDIEPHCPLNGLMSTSESHEITLRTNDGRSNSQILLEAVRSTYDIERDDAALRACAELPRDQRKQIFTRLRRDYPIRREFLNTRVTLEPFEAELANTLLKLQFKIDRSRQTGLASSDLDNDCTTNATR
ncbi:MAG: 4-phosphoerythronate dehydrogenase [Fuerstiella sp.]|nr:4-phosphoerythronate dehydrogenase [Fuerstiella sp.]